MKNVLRTFVLVSLFLLVPFGLFGKEKYDRFMVVTPQKTGSHLLTKAMLLLCRKDVLHYPNRDISREDLIYFLNQAKKNNAFLHMHAFPSQHIIDTLQELNYKVIFLMRDPRDQAISLLFYVHNHDWKYGPINLHHSFSQLSFDEQLDEVISGRRYGLSIPKDIIGKRIPWMHLPDDFVYVAYFENLVGKKGGGSNDKQYKELRGILKFLNFNLAKRKIKYRSKNLYGKPGDVTFRSGQIGDWNIYFTQDHIDAFKQAFGQELIDLGYENDQNW